MRTSLLMAALGAALCMPQHAAAKSPDPCALTVYTIVNLVIPDDATVLVPVTIGDHAVFMKLSLASLSGFIY